MSRFAKEIMTNLASMEVMGHVEKMVTADATLSPGTRRVRGG
jgi:hypothetical protein